MVTDYDRTTDHVEGKQGKIRTGPAKTKHNVIGYSEEIQSVTANLRTFCTRIYTALPRGPYAVKAERLISDLFNAYRSEPSMLPTSAQKIIDKRGLERTVCDYIAGMTDRYAIEEHQKLFNPLEKP